MAYVPGFKWDIFISYPMEAEAWTRRFARDLVELDGSELSKAIDPQVYFAGKDWKIGGSSDDMLEAARNSAVFVVILTREALSENHRQFLAREVERFQKSGPVRGRVCQIPLHPIDPSQLREAMPVLNPEAFWNTNVNFFYDDGDGIPLRLKPDSEPRPGEYSRRVIRVAHRLRELLEELRRDKSVKRAGSLAGTTVFLARKDTESAIEKEWLNVRAMLLSEGANVVPTPANTDVSPEADVELLQRADLFVQLFSALDSLNDAKAQLKAAEAESRRREKPLPILRWRKKRFDAQAEANFVRNLPEEDQTFCASGRTGTLEEFKLALSEELRAPQKVFEFNRRPPPGEAKRLANEDGRDIFISYAHEDRPRAQMLAQTLEFHGWSIFWDRRIPIGKTWRDTIGKELSDARCVIVLWSRSSIKSDWVHEEAEDARRRGILVPVLIEDVIPPFGFRSIQTADLINWNAKEPSEALRSLIVDITGLIASMS